MMDRYDFKPASGFAFDYGSMEKSIKGDYIRYSDAQAELTAQLAEAKDIIASLKDEITLMKHERVGLVEAGRILNNAVLYTRKTLCPECRGICAACIIGKAVGIALQELQHALPGKGETGEGRCEKCGHKYDPTKYSWCPKCDDNPNQ